MTSKETHQNLVIFPNEQKINLNLRRIGKTQFPVWSDSCYT